MIEVKSTRLELLKLKKRIKLASSGHSLLKRKRDGLVQELFRILKMLKESEAALTESYINASQHLVLARASENWKTLKSVSMASVEAPDVHVKVKTVMGVNIPSCTVEAPLVKKGPWQRNLGVIGTSASVDKAAQAYEELLTEIIETAEIEVALKKLLQEIEKTKRRVNALEYLLIPRMQDIAALISMRLDEMEREDIFRLKHFKKKKKRKSLRKKAGTHFKKKRKRKSVKSRKFKSK